MSVLVLPRADSSPLIVSVNSWAITLILSSWKNYDKEEVADRCLCLVLPGADSSPLMVSVNSWAISAAGWKTRVSSVTEEEV